MEIYKELKAFADEIKDAYNEWCYKVQDRRTFEKVVDDILKWKKK